MLRWSGRRSPPPSSTELTLPRQTAPGVVAVLTAADLAHTTPSARFCTVPSSSPPRCRQATDCVRYVGEPVALVLAETAQRSRGCRRTGSGWTTRRRRRSRRWMTPWPRVHSRSSRGARQPAARPVHVPGTSAGGHLHPGSGCGRRRLRFGAGDRCSHGGPRRGGGMGSARRTSTLHMSTQVPHIVRTAVADTLGLCREPGRGGRPRCWGRVRRSAPLVGRRSP